MRHYPLLVGVTLITLSSAYAGFKATSKTSSANCTSKTAGILDLGECLDVAAAAGVPEIDPTVLNHLALVPNSLCVEVKLKGSASNTWSSISSGFPYEKDEVSESTIKSVSLGNDSGSKKITLTLEGLASGRLAGTFSNYTLYDHRKDPPTVDAKFFLNRGDERGQSASQFGDDHSGFNSVVFFFGRPPVVENADAVSIATCKKLKLTSLDSFKPELNQCYWLDGKETVKVDGKDLALCW